MKRLTKFLLVFFLAAFLSGCKTLDTFKQEKDRDGIKETTLIDTSKVVEEGEKSIERKVKEGPKPIILKKSKEIKRKTLTTENVKNYVFSDGKLDKSFENYKSIRRFSSKYKFNIN